MAGPQKREAGGSPPPVHESIATEYVVARGRSLMVGGRFQGPGTPVNLPDEEVDHLLAAGFIARPDVEETGAGISVGGLQIKGGRKPGATVA